MFQSSGLMEETSMWFTEVFNGNSMDCIIPPTFGRGGLYLGNKDAALSLELLDQKKIRAVLTIDDQFGFDYFHTKVDHGFKQVSTHKHLKLRDSVEEDIHRVLESSCRWIEKMLSCTNVLVHCHAGASRSPTLVMAFLMQSKGLSLQEAFSHTRQIRPQVKPNLKFIECLLIFEAEVQEKRQRANSIKDTESESTECSDTRSTFSV